MMILNNLFPVFALIALGVFLKYLGLSNESFLKTSDRIVYFIFFPVMLFWKIGGASSGGQIDWSFCKAGICAVLILFALSTAYILLLRVSDYAAGTFSQSCYRFNTYIGIAVVMNALGEDGVRLFGILIGILIPMINVLAVSILIWFSGKNFGPGEKIRVTGKALISNPLILGCVAGILYARWVGVFPVFLENTFRLMTSATLPLAIISVGGALTFENLRGYFRLSLIASVFKLVLFPIVGYFCLRAFHVTGVAFKVSMIFFALPTSVSMYVLSSQLNSDTDLASASIMISTALSFFSLSAVLLM